MTAIAGIFSEDGRPIENSLVSRMLGQMRSRGGTHAQVWRERGALVVVSRQEWELGSDFSGPILIAQKNDLVVAADASLYYKADLRRKLVARGVTPNGDTPSHLILAAYEAFGDTCAEFLEGDFSFIVWDRKLRKMVAARDFAGKRPLYYASLAGNRILVVASSISTVLQHPACGTELDLFALGCAAANLLAAHDRTCYRDVQVVPTAHTITAGVVSRVALSIARHWTPPAFQGDSSVALEAAADELRDLLCKATNERLSTTGVTSIWMSGGADSPAVFACGQQVLRQAADGRRLLPVSISYPAGDLGREDELILSIAEHSQTPVYWIDSRGIPIFDQPAERAAKRDEPFAHAFEIWNRTLVAGSRSVGAHIALDGNGGDQLFQVSNYYLADLLRAGSLRTLRSQWRMRGMHGFHNFWASAVQPLIPDLARTCARALGLGSLVDSPYERPLPRWITPRFGKQHELLERERRNGPTRKEETLAAFEARWFLTHQYFPRVFSSIGQFGIESGIEIRSPLYDQRVISLASTRPRSERVSGRRTKQLLRHAMRGLLPEHVLAPRSFKTGVTTGFFDQGLRGKLSPLVADVFNDSSRLAALGVVDLEKIRLATVEYEHTHAAELGIALFQALQTELWLRGRDAKDRVGDGFTRVNAVPVSADVTTAA
jgi:asparagine synthase (glutamine-hydrolysing)